MDVAGKKTIDAKREFVWEALTSPEVLQAAIPGCQRFEKVGENAYEFAISLKVAAIVGDYTGEVKLLNPVEPESYTLDLSGSGALGHMQAAVQITLQDEEDKTVLSYAAEAEVGGKVAKVGQRVLSSVATLIVNQFFNSFVKQIKSMKEAAAVD